MLDSVMYTFY